MDSFETDLLNKFVQNEKCLTKASLGAYFCEQKLQFDLCEKAFVQNCFEQQYVLEDLHWKEDCNELVENSILLKNHPFVAIEESHIMAEMCMKDSHSMAVHCCWRSNFLFEEQSLQVAFVVSQFFTTMFCIICVKVCEIVVWYDEMVQFQNCSF